jgi:hypothetical protein
MRIVWRLGAVVGRATAELRWADEPPAHSMPQEVDRLASQCHKFFVRRDSRGETSCCHDRSRHECRLGTLKRAPQGGSLQRS